MRWLLPAKIVALEDTLKALQSPTAFKALWTSICLDFFYVYAYVIVYINEQSA